MRASFATLHAALGIAKVVGLASALLTDQEVREHAKGIVAAIKRIVKAPTNTSLAQVADASAEVVEALGQALPPPTDERFGHAGASDVPT